MPAGRGPRNQGDELVSAQRRWASVARRAVRAGAEPERVFALARAVVTRWWEQAYGWERETIWPRRLHLVACGDAGGDLERWRIVGRDAVVFPEVVAVADALLDPAMAELVCSPPGPHPVTGPAAAGKPTALLNVGRACHLARIRKNPAPPGSAHAAVAYVLVPPGATAKTLITEFARYLGIPVTTRMTQTQITDAVCHTYTQAGVQLVLIDEIHRLNPRTTTGAQTADLLKDLTERLPATFVYAGINVTDTPLFTGTRGAQLAGRATIITCGPLPARHGTRHPFCDLITDIENALDLTHHKPGTLPRHAAYIHQRTAGAIGSLTRLIRQAAITAIHDGTERITKTTLDAVQLDHLAEQHNRPTHNR
ncbi:ATP-binding protein [Streptomyces sp. NPDC005931]|uniref:ATP-binding protein n=1 Tax=Streptomyces sp. NPDC005931 TaxID=3364737 RepID=UPI0036BCBC0A